MWVWQKEECFVAIWLKLSFFSAHFNKKDISETVKFNFQKIFCLIFSTKNFWQTIGKSNLTWTSNLIMKLNATIWFLNAIHFLKVHKVTWNSIMLKVFKMKQRYFKLFCETEYSYVCLISVSISNSFSLFNFFSEIWWKIITTGKSILTLK